MGCREANKHDAFEAEHGYCKKRGVSLHVVEGRYRQQAMLYVKRVVALPIVCQLKRPRSLLAALLLSAVACARTGLYPGELGEADPGGDDVGGSSATGGVGAAGKSTGGVPVEPEPTAGKPPISTAGSPSAGSPSAGSPPVPVGEPPVCVPTSETCNGRDDDCDGAVDDLPPTPCPGGGSSFCVAGKQSQCPKRCDVCVPGSVRVCQNPFCSFWGEQECAADGQGFGHCREAEPPSECTAVAKKFEHSRQLEQCCLDNGYCCLDEFDLNGNGDRREMLGACGDVACQ